MDYSSLIIFLSLTISLSEELLPCEQQGAHEDSVTQPAGQRLLQQAAVDFLPAPSHYPIARQRCSGQPIQSPPKPRAPTLPHRWTEPEFWCGDDRHIGQRWHHFTRTKLMFPVHTVTHFPCKELMKFANILIIKVKDIYMNGCDLQRTNLCTMSPLNPTLYGWLQLVRLKNV